LLQFTELGRQHRNAAAAVEQVFQIPDHKGLDLPYIQKTILDRLTRIPGVIVDEPVQQ
jgi:hypothetical protein